MATVVARAVTVARGVVAATFLAAVGVGVPVLLVTKVGWPLPRALPAWSDITAALATGDVADRVWIGALATIGWLVWVRVVVGVGVELAMAAGASFRAVEPEGLQRVVAGLVAAVIAAVLTLAQRPLPVGAVAPLPAPVTATTVPTAATPPSPLAGSPSTPGNVEGPQVPTWTVRRGDSLWFISEVTLGDPYRWRQIAARNPQLCRDPNRLEEGWVLELPPDATVRSDSGREDKEVTVRPGDTLSALAHTHLGDAAAWPTVFAANVGRPQPDGRRLTDPDLIQPGWGLRLPAPGADGADAPSAPAGPPAAPAVAEATEPTPPPPEDAPPPTTPVESPATTPNELGRPRRGVELPSGSVVGIGLASAVGVGLAVVRLRRRARRRAHPPAPGIRYRDPLVTPTVRRLREAAACAAGPRLGREAEGPPPRSFAGCSPGSVAVGTLSEREVDLDLLDGPLDVEGPGAADLVRAVLAGVLAPMRPDELAAMVVGEALAEDLLPDSEIAGTEVSGDLAAVLARLEVEVIRRTRLAAEADVADFRAFAAAHPEEPLPLLVVVTEPPPADLEARFAAVTAPAARLGIAVVIVGRSDQRRLLRAKEDARLGASESLAHLDGAAYFRLTKAEAAELLGVIGAARRDVDPPEELEAAEAFEAPAPPRTRPPIEVDVLGPFEVRVDGEPVRAGLRTKARELLPFLAVHPEGVTWEAAVEAVWGDGIDPERAYAQWRTNLANIRSLRDALGDAEEPVVERVGERYRLNPAVVGCNLWRFEAGLADAATTADDTTTAEAFRRAADAYGGEFCQGSYLRDWSLPVGDDLRGRAIDVLTRLAELQAASGAREHAIETLERAMTIDPVAQDPGRRLVTLYGEVGRSDAARRAYERLERNLAEVDREPEPATTCCNRPWAAVFATADTKTTRRKLLLASWLRP